MSIITPEMIEAGAKAIFTEKSGLPNWDKAISQDNYRRYARACLEAALPGILERCAKEAEGPVYEERYRGGPGSNWVVDGSSPYGNGRLDAAASIRSLQTKDNA